MKSHGIRRTLRVFFLKTLLCREENRRKTGEDKNEKKVAGDESHCACCLKPFIIGRGFQCKDCRARFCRKACGRWEVKDNVRLCLFCYHKRTWFKKEEGWLDKFGGAYPVEKTNGQFITTRSRIYVTGVEDAPVNPGLDLAAGGHEEMDSLEKLREIIEKVVENLVGKADDAPIDRIYRHSSYKPAADTPSMAHSALRELVERAVDEARKLPILGDSMTTRIQDNTSTDEQTYEDLLATAILNKVVQKCQKARVDGNSNVLHEAPSKSCRHRGFGASAVDDSSLDPMSQDEACSDSSRTKIRVHHEPLSLTIEEQIEEVTTTYTSDDEPRNVKANVLHFRNAKRVPFPEYGMDIVDPSQESSDSEDEIDACVSVSHVTPLETWEENWLFQRKKIAAQPEPVAMLVPNPSEDYRALIGDKDADDMSDLSEFSAQSDEEVDEDLVEAINKAVPASPNVGRVPLGVHKTKSSILHDNFTGEIVCENSNDVGSPDKPSPGTKIESEIVKKEEKPENIIYFKTNNAEIENNFENTLGDDTSKNEDIKEDDKNYIPKTPVATPIRFSLSESDSVSLIACDLQELNEKLIAIHDSESDEDVDRVGCLLPEVERQQPEESGQLIPEAVDREKNFNHTPACQAAAAAAKAGISSSMETKSNGEDPELSAPPRPGSIAEREHKKWENAAPLQNNPYSEENIQKRLLERQYARRSSDVRGSGALSSSPSPPLKIILGGNRPDVQRFARDYYINEAKSPTGERYRRPGTSNSSRPSSSLSQNSASTSSDYDHQESFELIETTKSQNNLEAEPQVIEEILERERKNSKNEINAKLNNQGNFDSPIFEGKQSFTDDNNRKIRRIDLRAYGFANQFDASNECKRKTPRVVNKLDLRSYGYDSGLRRTQSNNHIDSKVNNSFVHIKRKNDRIVGKSNLTQSQSMRLGGGDYIWIQSSEDLNKKEMMFDNLGGITSAKSVPNIARISSYTYNGNKIGPDDETHPPQNTNGSSNRVDSCDSDSQNSRTESADEMPRNLPISKEMRYSLESLEGPDRFIDALPMPSVRRLAQTFNASPEVKPTPVPRVNKAVIRDRPTTPEIHIIKSPRQMHSLTARSLSREFREGLKNISCKPNAQPVYSTIIEQSRIPAGSTISKISEDNKKIITSGNLRNNIQFWEQLQRKP
ncbi:uncharacterized protein [Fopius arisanus]|uniref:Uncharacterized protein isoform X2 n=1 Tax=Fopius arisanus TaxID=64838 RepID=A0A9R1T4H9_9HYME|nr:PREDICTED: uncharacterized protein LOC105266298 isoform X2 [Fopius arisanus]